MARQTQTQKVDELADKVHQLDKDLDLVKYKAEEITKDVERLTKLVTTLDSAFTRLKEQVDPIVRGVKWVITLVIGAVVTALIALVVRQ
jgi:peptidoglycan hydrolase CwlO-like protein